MVHINKRCFKNLLRHNLSILKYSLKNSVEAATQSGFLWQQFCILCQNRGTWNWQHIILKIITENMQLDTSLRTNRQSAFQFFTFYKCISSLWEHYKRAVRLNLLVRSMHNILALTLSFELLGIGLFSSLIYKRSM